MPIHCPLTIRPITEGEFNEIDRLVMACCYAAQNTLGRLCEERVYENDVAARLRAEGLTDVHTQVPVTVTHAGFSKIYRLDLVVRQMVYEIKVVAGFVPEHDAQVFHYAAALDIDRVKLLNFRTAKVTGLLRRSPLVNVDRTRVIYDLTRMTPLSDRCEALPGQFRDLIADWGAYLEARLYEEALIHFNGGENTSVRRVPVVRDGIELGTHRVQCHAEGVAFLVTAMTADPKAYEEQLRRLMSFTPLRGMQWINLNHNRIEVVTVRNGRGMEAKE